MTDKPDNYPNHIDPKQSRPREPQVSAEARARWTIKDDNSTESPGLFSVPDIDTEIPEFQKRRCAPVNSTITFDEFARSIEDEAFAQKNAAKPVSHKKYDVSGLPTIHDILDDPVVAFAFRDATRRPQKQRVEDTFFDTLDGLINNPNADTVRNIKDLFENINHTYDIEGDEIPEKYKRPVEPNPDF